MRQSTLLTSTGKLPQNIQYNVRYCYNFFFFVNRRAITPNASPVYPFLPGHLGIAQTHCFCARKIHNNLYKIFVFNAENSFIKREGENRNNYRTRFVSLEI